MDIYVALGIQWQLILISLFIDTPGYLTVKVGFSLPRIRF